MPVPSLFLVSCLVFLVINAHRCQQLPPLDWIVHHRLVCLLFLPLDREQRVLPDLGRHIARIGGRGRRCDKGVLARLLLQLLHLVVLEKLVDAPLAEEVSLVFGGIARLAVGRSRVHPFHPL